MLYLQRIKISIIMNLKKVFNNRAIKSSACKSSKVVDSAKRVFVPRMITDLSEIQVIESLYNYDGSRLSSLKF